MSFSDDTALLAESPNELQAMVNRVVEVSENLGMKVNIEKTEIQHMGRAHKDFNIVIKNQNLKQTVNFVYLGGNLSSKEGTISDVKRWIGIVRAAFQALGKVWSARDITTTTKLQVYDTLVLSRLLYNLKNWTMKCSSQQRLNVFEMACLRRIPGCT